MGVKFDPNRMRRTTSTPASLNASFLTAFTGANLPEGTIRDIPVEQIDAWSNQNGEGQPFRLYPEDKLADMAQNIKEHGILNPCIVRPRDGRYQLLAGHNRTAAAKLAGMTVIPCIIKEVEDDTAALYMIDSNLYQREQILPSERAAAYAMKLAIYRRQGKRTDLTGEAPSSAAERVAEESGESARSVQRYARLTHLTPELMKMVDDGKIPITVGSKIAGLDGPDQECLYQSMQETKKEKLSVAQIDEIRELTEDGKPLQAEPVKEILTGNARKREDAINGVKMQKVSIPEGEIHPNVWKVIKKDEHLQQLLYETARSYVASLTVENA